jgi:hypothetical protein
VEAVQQPTRQNLHTKSEVAFQQKVGSVTWDRHVAKEGYDATRHRKIDIPGPTIQKRYTGEVTSTAAIVSEAGNIAESTRRIGELEVGP